MNEGITQKIIEQDNQDKKYVSTTEVIMYALCGFFYSMSTGMVINYRNAYLVNILQVTSLQASTINIITTIFNFILSFFVAMLIDRNRTKYGKFRPLGVLSAIPLGILVALNFYTPESLGRGSLMVSYLCLVTILYNAFAALGAVVNNVGAVMSPNDKERNSILSWKGITSAVGQSAPLLIVVIVGLIVKTDGMLYLVSAIVCAACGVFFMVLGMKMVKERIVYAKNKQTVFRGVKDLTKNKNAMILLVSEFLKNFRQLATYMGVFLAAGYFNNGKSYILFALPTGIGTIVGMLIVKALLKKYDGKKIYIGFGIYSLIANIAAFGMGYLYFKSGTNEWLGRVFFLMLFVIGFQFGATNLLPNIFNADVLEEIELKTGKRLDATLTFFVNLGGMLSGLIATGIAPKLLYEEGSLINYLQPIEQIVNGQITTVYLDQSERTMLWMLFFYTVFHGICLILSCIPYIFYDLTDKKKEEIHIKVLEEREKTKLEKDSLDCSQSEI